MKIPYQLFTIAKQTNIVEMILSRIDDIAEQIVYPINEHAKKVRTTTLKVSMTKHENDIRKTIINKTIIAVSPHCSGWAALSSSLQRNVTNTHEEPITPDIPPITRQLLL
jgi:hypothetical protein